MASEIDPFSMLEVSLLDLSSEKGKDAESLSARSSAKNNKGGADKSSTKSYIEMASDQGLESLNIACDSPYNVPLMLGWRREVVLRSNCNNSKADIYYVPPKGKKCRSFKDVEKAIHDTELTLEGFTFAKKLLGLNDPSKEVIRSASGTSPFKKTSLDESIDCIGHPPNKKTKRTPKHTKSKPEMKTDVRPDVMDKPSGDASSDLKNDESEVTDSSNVLESLKLKRSICTPAPLTDEGSLTNEPNATTHVPNSTTDSRITSSVQDHEPMIVPEVSLRVCSCEMCSSVDEKSVCCCDVPIIAAVKSEFQCITHHIDFEKLILDDRVLSITRHMLSVKTKNKNKKNLLNTKTPLNITWRYIAYKQFVSWINSSTSIGSRLSVAIPSCVVSAVRERFPEQNGSYQVLKFSA